MLYLHPEFSSTAPPSRQTFSGLLTPQGEVIRQAKGRTTFCFPQSGKRYFLKIHTGVGWGEIFKNLAQLRLPVVSAAPEWRAIERLRQLGIDTARPIGYGIEGVNPARLRSFILTEDVGDTITVEEILERWKKHGQISRSDLILKRFILRRIGEIARRMHLNGINHRDFYLCHLRIPLSHLSQAVLAQSLPIYVMDLHRAQIRTRTPLRWIVKDLAGLLFSSFELGLTQRDRVRVATAYSSLPVRAAFQHSLPFWEQISRKAAQIQAHHLRRYVNEAPATASCR
jgi:heptose I phosphotransferase